MSLIYKRPSRLVALLRGGFGLWLAIFIAAMGFIGFLVGPAVQLT